MHTAKTNLSKLVAQVEAGEEVIIGRGGKPVAKLVAYSDDRPPRQLGLLEGRAEIHDNFDDPLPEEILAPFRGERR